MRRYSHDLMVVLSLAVLASPALARPAHKQAIALHMGPFLAAKLNDCRLCHLPGETAEGEDKPHNPFGERLAAIKTTLRKSGQPTDIPARLAAIAEEDADGDGIANLAELLLGHQPGDKTDQPSAEELKTYAAVLADYQRFLASYPWRPFEPLTRPALPAVQRSGWVLNGIDAFIAAEQEAHGVTPRPSADRATLLRRVTLDLTGLPPTPAELRAFESDTDPNAYEKVVDRLLESPAYGERWGRHWMDVWRYSDWAGWSGGGQIRDSQPHIWRWRDWIIESLNEDKPYDRMIVEMLAGDEVAPNDPATLRATGYLVRNYKMLSREKWMQDVVDHTFQAFQATTLGCARCHDHMYDPITQKEYYQVRAVFEPHKVRTDRIPGQLDTKKDGLVRAYDAELTAPTYFYIRGDERTPDKSAALPPGVPMFLNVALPEIKPVPLPREASAPDLRDFVIRENLQALEHDLATARKQADELTHRLTLVAALPPMSLTGMLATLTARTEAERRAAAEVDFVAAKLAARRATLAAEALDKDAPGWKEAAMAAVVAQRQQALAQAQRDILVADAKKRPIVESALKKAEAEAKLPPGTNFTRISMANYPTTSSGRRLALARWITDPANPLTARVAVNHIWLRHFGQAIVPSVFDFGRNGRRPTHPALLDWLAAELQASGWRMKPLHRLMVTSQTYRQMSTPDEANLAKDRDNLWLWRMNPRRLEAEIVRDQLLALSGQLDLSQGGADIDHMQGLEVPRRSLYFRHAAEKQMEFLKLFDAAGVTECYQRKESIIPQQALALANSPLAVPAARLIARELVREVGPDAQSFVRAAFERVLVRRPTAEELAACQAFVERLSEGKPPTAESLPRGNGRQPALDPGLRARENLVSVLVNHHEFVTVR